MGTDHEVLDTGSSMYFVRLTVSSPRARKQRRHKMDAQWGKRGAKFLVVALGTLAVFMVFRPG